MFDRQWLGDLALAVLIALPLTGLARTQPVTHQTLAKAAFTNAVVDRSPGHRMGLLA